MTNAEREYYLDNMDEFVRPRKTVIFDRNLKNRWQHYLVKDMFNVSESGIRIDNFSILENRSDLSYEYYIRSRMSVLNNNFRMIGNMVVSMEGEYIFNTNAEDPYDVFREIDPDHTYSNEKLKLILESNRLPWIKREKKKDDTTKVIVLDCTWTEQKLKKRICKENDLDPQKTKIIKVTHIWYLIDKDTNFHPEESIYDTIDSLECDILYLGGGVWPEKDITKVDIVKYKKQLSKLRLMGVDFRKHLEEKYLSTLFQG